METAFLLTGAGNREVMDFPNDTVNDAASPPLPAHDAAGAVNGERPILDEMIARMQREQDERSGATAGTSSGHQLRNRNTDQPTGHTNSHATTSTISSICCTSCCTTLGEVGT